MSKSEDSQKVNTRTPECLLPVKVTAAPCGNSQGISVVSGKRLWVLAKAEYKTTFQSASLSDSQPRGWTLGFLCPTGSQNLITKPQALPFGL